MQEITLYVFRQNRLRFMLIWYHKLIKSQVQNRHKNSKNCKHVLSLDSLPCRRFYGSSYFVPPHKCLLNRRQHSFPTLSQSRCTFQILESWPWLQGNPITMRSAWNFENLKPSWPLINVRLRAAKVRFTQSDFRIIRALYNLSEGRKEGKR